VSVIELGGYKKINPGLGPRLSQNAVDGIG
jgi:hypothetical protein